MKHYRLLFMMMLIITSSSFICAQDNSGELPFRKIPDYPSEFTAATTIARIIDALGFRYYWATEGLRSEDLNYQPSEKARTADKTIDHIFSLCATTASVITGQQVKYPELSSLSFEEKRRLTLEVLKSASDFLHTNPETDLEELIISAGNNEFPFWNLINGQIADALTHVGQIVSFRRSSGNPVNPKVSVFSGVLIGE